MLDFVNHIVPHRLFVPAAAVFVAVALAACNGDTSGPGGGGDNNGAAASGAVGLAARSFVTPNNTDSALARWSGTHPVAIYATPVGKASNLGEGTLTLSRDGNWVIAELKGPSGTTIGRIRQDRVNGSFTVNGAVQVYPSVGTFISSQYDAAFRNITIYFGNGTVGRDSTLWGTLGAGDSIYRFRNNVAYFGATPPPVFATVAGTWSGPQQALTCGRPNDTAVVTAAGAVTVRGKGNLSCADAVIENTWDGQDDYVESVVSGTSTAYRIIIDRERGGGSAPQGGVRLTVSALAAPAVITQVSTNLSGAAGEITFNDPARHP